MTAAGWLEGLRWALEQYEPDVELGICSWGHSFHEPFTRDNATYFALNAHRPRTRGERMVEAWRCRLVPPEAVTDAASVTRRFRPDIVHVHGTEHPLGLAALRLPFPAVATLQGIASAIERFVLEPVPDSEILRGLATRNFLRGDSYLHWSVRMKRAAATERTVVGGLHHFMGQTSWDRNVLRVLNPSAKYYTCPRALQPDYYRARWRGISGAGTTIFCTSGPAPYKGIETLLEGFALLRDAGYKGIRLRVAGRIPGSILWPMVERIVRRRHLEGLVTWLGRLAAAELAAELAQASMFVLPSHIENESNALIEAMLIGLPCVAAAVGGVPSVLCDGEDGLLYNDSDPFSLAGSLACLLDEPALAVSLAAGAYDRARTGWSAEVAAHRVKAVYEEIVAAERAQ